MYLVDHLKDSGVVEFEDGKVLPSVLKWTTVKVAKIGYEQAESFLYFLDKYVTVMVGGSRGLNKFYKNNHSKTLLDRLTASDIAYCALIYESAYDVWEEEITKQDTCETREEKRAFKSTATLKHYVKRGSRIALFQDGWTKEGKEYFRGLCCKYDELIKAEKVWDNVRQHWETYTHKYHATRYECENNGVHGSFDDHTGDDDDEEDCIISLPGEFDEQGFEDDLEDDEDDCSGNQRKRQRIVGV